MGRVVFVLAVLGCHAGTRPASTENPMPLPGESAPTAAVDEPNFRVDPSEHPGRLSEDEIDTVLQYANPEVTACYERVLAESPEVRGTAMTVFVIGTDGAVTAAASSGIDARVARCLDDVVARRVFPPPRGGTVKVRYPFTFNSGGSRSDDNPAIESGMGDTQTRARAQTTRVTCGRRR